MIKRVDLEAEECLQVCDACGKERIIDLTRVSLGGSRGDVVALPTCSCGSTEALLRTFSGAFARASASGHHLAVNRLADHLRTRGRVADSAKAHVALETQRPYGARELADVVQYTPASIAVAFAVGRWPSSDPQPEI